jgi:hypothetical protein
VIGGSMLNFGYWNGKTDNLVQAQQELCRIVGKFAELDSAKRVFTARLISRVLMLTYFN